MRGGDALSVVTEGLKLNLSSLTVLDETKIQLVDEATIATLHKVAASDRLNPFPAGDMPKDGNAWRTHSRPRSR